jgi:hypothetical protein
VVHIHVLLAVEEAVEVAVAVADNTNIKQTLRMKSCFKRITDVETVFW